MAVCIPIISAISVFYVTVINFIFSFLPVTGNALTFTSLTISSSVIFLLVKFFKKPQGMFADAAYVLLYVHIGIYILAFLCGI